MFTKVDDLAIEVDASYDRRSMGSSAVSAGCDPGATISSWFLGFAYPRVAEISRASIAELPQLAAIDGSPALVEESVAAHFRMVGTRVGAGRMDALAHGEAELPAACRELIASGVANQVPLDVLVRHYEIGCSLLWQYLTVDLQRCDALVPAVARTAVLEQFGALLFGYLPGAVAALATSYNAALMRREWPSERRRVEAVRAILAGQVSPAEIEALLRYRLDTAHLAYVAWGDDSTALDDLVSELRRRTAARQHLSVRVAEDTIWGWVALRDPAEIDQLRAAPLPRKARLALGSLASGVNGFRDGHREAIEAQRIARTVNAEGIVAFSNVAVTALASKDVELMTRFVCRELDGLLGDHESARRLIATLRIYLAEQASPTRAARRIGVHVNTVVYRVKRAEELLGRPIDPGSLELRLAIELAPFVHGVGRG